MPNYTLSSNRILTFVMSISANFDPMLNHIAET